MNDVVEQAIGSVLVFAAVVWALLGAGEKRPMTGPVDRDSGKERAELLVRLRRRRQKVYSVELGADEFTADKDCADAANEIERLAALYAHVCALCDALRVSLAAAATDKGEPSAQSGAGPIDSRN
jgi:hypothetical protein